MAFRIRFNISEMGSVIIDGDFLLPTGLDHSGDIPPKA
jgi:hypothetical protein